MKQFYNVQLFTSAAAQNPSDLGAVWSLDFWPADGQPAVFQSHKEIFPKCWDLHKRMYKYYSYHETDFCSTIYLFKTQTPQPGVVARTCDSKHLRGRAQKGQMVRVVLRS